MIRLREFFAGLAWHRLVPEQNHEVATAGYGAGIATTLTARTVDQKLAINYISSGGDSRKLSVLAPASLQVATRRTFA
jgi:hypothetical protein